MLGWSNLKKIRALENKHELETGKLQKLALQVNALNGELDSLRQRTVNLISLGEYRDYRDLDWRPLVEEIANLEEELESLRSASGGLKELIVKLDQLKSELNVLEDQIEQENGEWCVVQQKEAEARDRLIELRSEPPTDDQK